MGRKFRGVKPASATTIEITFTYQGVRCRERLKLKPSPANLAAASRHRQAVIHAIESGTFDYAFTFPNSKNAAKFATTPGRLVTVGQQLDEWLKGARHSLKTSTYRGYEKIVIHQLTPAFGHYSLPDLKRRHVKQWAMEHGGTNKTINNILSPLRQALAEAFEDELIDSNPLYGWTFRSREAPKRVDDVDPFTQAEQEAILAGISGQGRNLLQFAFWTGLRPSEYVALDWGDVDFHRGVIRVWKALTQASNEPETTKTAAGEREVKLLPKALEAIQSQKAHTFLRGQEIFQNPRTGERWKGDQPIRKTLWINALKKAGVRYRRPYQTRHTFASMLLTAGESPIWVAQQMGHSDWTMIARVYGRFIPDAQPDAGMKAHELFGDKAERLR